MKKSDISLLIALASVVVTITLWVRHNIPFFQPILESSTLFFQLILAATLIAVMRNLIGIRTFGVFGPTIIALGIIGAGIIWGLILYINVFIVAMLTGLAIYPLAIASSHRIAVVIIITVFAITILELVAEVYRIDILQTSILFPVLITSWLADRFVAQIKETDWIEPSKKILGTLIVIIVSYYAISLTPVINFIALNPETWGLMILINIVLALKVNFRLSEYIRFKPAMISEKKNGNVLGLNKRNRDYIARYNPANLYPQITKDKMKITFHQLGIPTPETYAIIQTKKDLEVADKVMKQQKSFVIKPASGMGGEGILVVDRGDDERDIYYSGGGRKFTRDNLKNHITQILDGQFSSEWSDNAIIEEKIHTSSSLDGFYWKGVPDIRIIVFEGFPLMAMTRLPTKESGGAANIHKGAISMGLTIAEGKAINPFWRGHGGSITRHPDTNIVLTGLEIKDWSKLLEIASMAQGASRLGYAGVDIVLDEKGPRVLEVNKRPGLEIQNTNLAGLLRRIEFVENQLSIYRFKTVREKVKLSQKWDKGGWN